MVVAENYGWGEEVQVCLQVVGIVNKNCEKLVICRSFWEQEFCQRRGISGENGSVFLAEG